MSIADEAVSYIENLIGLSKRANSEELEEISKRFAGRIPKRLRVMIEKASESASQSQEPGTEVLVTP